MKIVIEKYVCDVCGAEVTDGRHYVINMGLSVSGSGDAKIETLFKKDLCHDCANIIAQLIEGKTDSVKEEQESEPKHERLDGRKHRLDKDLIKELWARGLTYKQITAKTGYTNAQITYVINRTTKEEREALKEQYSPRKEIQEEDYNEGITYTTDENGLVISMK